MKIQVKDTTVVVGKRITVGAAISGVATAIAHFIPEHAVAIMAITTPLIFVVQLWIVNRYGITTK